MGFGAVIRVHMKQFYLQITPSGVRYSFVSASPFPKFNSRELEFIITPATGHKVRVFDLAVDMCCRPHEVCKLHFLEILNLEY